MIPDDLARARPADLRRGATAGCPQTLRPLHNARRCHLQRHGHLPDTLPFGPPRQRAFAQIHRNRTGHRSSFPCRRHDSESTQAEQRNPHTIQIESSRSRRCSRPQPSCLRFRRCPLEDRTAPRRHPRAHRNPGWDRNSVAAAWIKAREIRRLRSSSACTSRGTIRFCCSNARKSDKAGGGRQRHDQLHAILRASPRGKGVGAGRTPAARNARSPKDSTSPELQFDGRTRCYDTGIHRPCEASRDRRRGQVRQSRVQRPVEARRWCRGLRKNWITRNPTRASR